MSDAGDFIDAALRREASWERADQNHVPGLRVYGASMGAVRGAIRDAGGRYRSLTRDDIAALSSELWDTPVFERRLATMVLLQTHVTLLGVFDLTRIEGFLRDSRTLLLLDPLAVDVVGPLVASLDPHARRRADAVLDRWASDGKLARAAVLCPLREIRSGAGDVAGFRRRANIPLPGDPRLRAERDDAVATVEAILARSAPPPHGMV